jgi:hypothetical protein
MGPSQAEKATRGFARKEEESGNEKTFRTGEGRQQEDSSSSLSLIATVVAATRACFIVNVSSVGVFN